MRQVEQPIPAPVAVGIGHVHLRVADLDRAVAFYRDVLGLTLNAYGPDLGVPGPRSWPPGAITTTWA
jgi:catechol 2,3-dioxygenase-like lactoylglutathione lyase family enzyme